MKITSGKPICIQTMTPTTVHRAVAGSPSQSCASEPRPIASSSSLTAPFSGASSQLHTTPAMTTGSTCGR